MKRYMIQQHVLILNHYYQNGESLVATILQVRPIFGRKNVPTSSTVKGIMDKFESTGSFVDIKHMTRARSETNWAAGRESVAEKSEDL